MKYRYINILQLLTVFLFGILIVIPELNSRLTFIKEEKGNENRTKFKKPVAEFDHLDKFVKEFDSYYTDNFSLRENLIKLHNNFEFYLWGISPVPDDVIIGKENWFYDVNNLPDYKGTNLFTPSELTKLQNELSLRTSWAESIGIKYYVAIIPNKMRIYPEYLPKKVIKVSSTSRYDQLVALDKRQGIRVIDMRANLLQHKNEDNFLYQHTDGHWNELGSYFGYQSIMLRIAEDFPELTPAPLNDYDISIEEREGGLAKMMNVEKDQPEKFVKLSSKKKEFGHDGVKRGYKIPKGISDWDYEIVKVNDHGKKLKCLIIRDSFTLQMIQYLQEHFKETVFIHGEWKAAMNEDFIMQEKPDIVINILVETFAGNLFQFPFSPPFNVYNRIQLKTSTGSYVTTGNDHILTALKENRDSGATYSFIKLPDNECAFLSTDKNFISADLGHLNELIANRDKISSWEKFKIVELGDNHVAFKAANGKYLSVDNVTSQIFATGETIGAEQKFEMIVKQ